MRIATSQGKEMTSPEWALTPLWELAEIDSRRRILGNGMGIALSLGRRILGSISK